MLPEDGPCQPWCTWADVVACRADLDDISEPATELALELSTDILYHLTGKRYPGECETTRSICQPCGCARSACSGCGPFSRIDLGGRWRVSDVLSVIVDGAAVPSSAWRVDDWRWLVRIDGMTWPTSVDLTDPAAFQVTWVYGRVPSKSLQWAAAIFAGEIAAKCSGKKCGIPQRVTNVVRAGVSYTVFDPQRFLDDGRVGLYEVDLAITAANKGRKARPGIFAPTCAPQRVATGTDAGGS